MRRRPFTALVAVLSAACIACCAVASGAAAVPPRPSRAAPAASSITRSTAFSAALERIVEDGVPGVIALARRGDRTVVDARGTADLATGAAMTPADRVRVGSITKTFVAAVVLQLVAEHRLRLGDTVARWLPGLVPSGSIITVRQLLQHTSGIFDYTQDANFLAAIQAHPTRAWRPKKLVRIAVAHPALFAPGTSWAYSNTDYILLGLIVRAATGRGLLTQLRTRILGPLHLVHTSFPLAGTSLPRPHSHGYLLNQPGAPGPIDVTRVSPSIAWAAGALVSTARDVARFYAALLSGRLLPRRLLRAMLDTVQVGPATGYGLGLLSVALPPCGQVWGHNGDFPGYYSDAFSDRDGDRQIILLINADSDGLSDRQQADLAVAARVGMCGRL